MSDWPPPASPKARGSFNWVHIYNAAYKRFLGEGEHASSAHLGALEVVIVESARRLRKRGGA